MLKNKKKPTTEPFRRHAVRLFIFPEKENTKEYEIIRHRKSLKRGVNYESRKKTV